MLTLSIRRESTRRQMPPGPAAQLPQLSQGLQERHRHGLAGFRLSGAPNFSLATMGLAGAKAGMRVGTSRDVRQQPGRRGGP